MNAGYDIINFMVAYIWNVESQKVKYAIIVIFFFFFFKIRAEGLSKFCLECL